MKRQVHPVTCDGCGDAWDHDPRLDVDCPTCHAKAGTDCLRPSEHRISRGFGGLHSARKKLAFKINPCSCLKNWEEAQRKQSLA